METVVMIKIAVVAVILMICAYQDIKEKRISFELLVAGTVIVTILAILAGDHSAMNCILGSFIGIVLLVVSKATKGALGIGDALLVGMVGIAVGFFETLLVLFYGLVITAVVSITLLLLHRVKKQTQMPFVPFVLIGYLGVVFSW